MESTLTLAIIGHLVGDYLIQNDWMALNKKKKTLNCAVHVTLWTAAVCFFAGWWTVPAVALLWVTHFIQDRTTIINGFMNLIGQKQFASGPCAPWSIIVVDNVWHIVTIWAVWRFIV
jgi:hypothetical protein